MHSDVVLHYHFEVPEGWIEIPREVLDSTFEKFANQAGIAVPDYEAGYQVNAENYFTYPYLLVQHRPVDSATIRQIASALETAEDAPGIQKLGSSGLMGNISIGTPVVDEAKKLVVLKMDSEVQGVGAIKILSISAPGRNGMVNLHLYARASDYEEHLESFQGVVESFAFNEGYEYNWVTAMARSVVPAGSRILRRALIGALLGGLVAAWSLRRKRRAADSGREA